MTELPIYCDVNLRHDFILLFDVTDGNPNGDPDASNMPRVDPETMQGIVTDVALKRKVRDFIDATRGSESSYKIYVQKGTALNTQHNRAYKALEIKPQGVKQPAQDISRTRSWMCQNFFDIRMFGAVMTTGVNCGQVRGAVQLTFARSLDRIIPMEITITRLTVTKEEDLVKVVPGQDGEDDAVKGKKSDMGRKVIVPYGLYRVYGFFNPYLAKDTQVTGKDLELFWEALIKMWDFDRSATHGMMASQGLYIFSHASALGNAPAYDLFKYVRINKLEGVKVPRSIEDYSVSVDEGTLPKGITLTRL